MVSTVYADYDDNTPVRANWLNDVNDFVYSPTSGTPNGGQRVPTAWVRFVGATGVVQQSLGVQAVTRNSTGNYTITYAEVLPAAQNCYDICTSQAGFAFVSAEAAGSVTITTKSTLNVAADPGFVCVVVYGSQ